MTTPYWFPAATDGGSMRANRLVMPIPPGTHWTEVKAVARPDEAKVIESKPRPKLIAAKPAARIEQTSERAGEPAGKRSIGMGALRLDSPPKTAATVTPPRSQSRANRPPHRVPHRSIHLR